MSYPSIYSNGQHCSWARYQFVIIDPHILDLFYLRLQYRVKCWYGYTWVTVAQLLYVDTNHPLDFFNAKQELQELARETARQRRRRNLFARRVRKEVGHEA